MIYQRILNVLDQFELTEIDISKINMKSSIPGDLGLVSLEMVMLCISLEEEFGIRIDLRELHKLVTIEDVCRYIETNPGGCGQESALDSESERIRFDSNHE